MLTRTSCLKTGPARKQLVRVQIIVVQNSSELLPLQYMQTCVIVTLTQIPRLVSRWMQP